MITIGTFTKTETGFTGTIKTLSLHVKVKIVPATNKGERQPDYRIFAGSVELGACWKKVSDTSGRDYLSVSLDDPSFPAPLYAMLFESEDGDGTANLVWSRPTSN
jgi:uncharacterized protein (DUF736 family)